ncbi:iron complex outermembrane receptor protein [Fulvimonas soli]|jgi:iron complex outermembrane receptor protein|uniref:Iron complex outermembrane receptor protein n=1 Tax=Fulvimonas soli TaxID=155197 RepID=A0A316I5U1_9GAMM|nr:TonB-dependent receptor [Fulvimonas soli]PWK88636.1 iron complex outermembrane receptor protein [Fulvimonas soli]
MSPARPPIRRALLPAALLALSPAFAHAQDEQAATPEKAKNLGTVIVTGTRADNRTESSSLTPIDVVSAKVLQQTGTNDLPTALSRIIPSLTFPRPSAADTADTQRPAQLRGLSPDQVLVLVNGKRWHPGAIILTNGVLGRGSQAVDLNTIPVSAIDHIEVLRDGASAQYGSDAIAGVINIILKKGAEGGDVELTGGQYTHGDGRQWQGSANFGLPLAGDRGWLRFTVQSGNQDYTNHAGADTRPAYSGLGVNFREGDPAVHDNNLLLNAQYDFGPAVQLYAFGHFGHRDSTSPAFFRYGNSSPLIAGIYPDGYLPLENADSTDRSLVLGLRGTAGGWRWDVSGNYGGNRVSYETRHSINLAWLNDFGDSPRNFDDGVLDAAQQSLDVDLAREFSPGWLPNPVTVAFGAEYLRQTYGIHAGEPASWYVGTSGVSGGAQGFAGWQPVSAGSWSRHDVAEYLDVETNLTDRLGVSAAVRHEDYTDFGNTTSGSLAGRFDFTDGFALRASASTGFRAPSLAQQHYSTVSSLYYGEGNSLGLPAGIYNAGLVPVDNQVARLLGAEPLKPEKSHNYTLGAVWSPTAALTLSVDAYQIRIDNRIVLSSSIATTGPTVQAYLAANGVSNLNYSGVSYFTNAADTRTRGVDFVATYLADLGDAGTLQTTLSANYNKNEVTRVKPNPAVLDALGVSFKRLDRRDIKGLMADTTPRSKLILSEQYDAGRWGVTGTLTRYGRYTAYNATNYALDQTFSPKWLLDLAVNYNVDRWSFTLGADDALDTYPDKNVAANSNNGTLPYSVFSPFGYNGAYVYGKVAYRW